MLTLKILLDARNTYENSFASHHAALPSFVEKLSDRDLALSCHVYVATSGDRRFQITLMEDGISCAFMKKVGYPEEKYLLHIHVTSGDLMIDKCGRLLDAWLLTRSEFSIVADLAKEF